MAGLFRVRDFVLLWGGQSVSELGSAVGSVAFPLVAVLVLRASAFEVGVVAAAGPAAWLLVGLPAGAWVDRVPRRLVLIGCDAGRAVLTVAVQRLRQEIAAGLRYAWSHPLIRSVAVTGTLANLVIGGYNAVDILFLGRQLALAPGLIGVLLSVAAVGGMLGSLLAAPLARRLGDARVMWGSLIVAAAGGLLIPLTATGARLAWYVAGTLPLIMGIAAFIVCVRSAVQATTPEAMRGRVTATIRLFGRGATPLGALAAGAIAATLTPRTALVILMAFLVLAPVWLLHTPIRRVRDVAELTPAP